MIDHTHCHKEIASLRSELNDAYATIDHLKSLLNPPSLQYPAEFNLTVTESAMLDCLRATKGICTNDRLMLVINNVNGNRTDRDTKVVAVFICKLRKKLKAIEVEIKNAWGVGHYLTDDGKAKINEAALAKKHLPSWSELNSQKTVLNEAH